MWKNYIFIVFVLLLSSSCAAPKTVKELKAMAPYQKVWVANKTYEECINIIKSEFEDNTTIGLNCINYYDLQKGECSLVGHGVFLFYAKAEQREDRKAQVEIFFAGNHSDFIEKLNAITDKINKPD